MKKVVIILLLFCFVFSGCNGSSEANLKAEKIAVNDIVINKSHAYVNEGEKVVLLAQVFPFNADNQKVDWKSDNVNIATVDGGIVVGKSEGRTVITATSEDGQFSTNCIVYVSTPKLNYNNYQNKIKDINQNTNNLNIEDENNSIFNFLNFNKINYFFNEIFNTLNHFEAEFKEFEDYFKTISKNYSLINKQIKADIEAENEGLTEDKTVKVNEEENKNYVYSLEYKYNSEGIKEEDDENTVYKDDYTIIKEKFNEF